MRTLSLLLLAACGSSSPTSTDAPTTAVTYRVQGATPKLFVYRDGDGSWRAPQPASTAGDYTLAVTDAFQAVVVCADSSGFDVMELAQTAGEVTLQYVYCTRGSTVNVPSPVTVTGEMAQAGEVDMDSQATSSTPNWTFSLEVTPGPHELIAFDDDHLAIRRDQMIAATSSVPAIDVVQQGMPIARVPVTISGVEADETTDLVDTIYLAHDTAILGSPDDVARTVPPSALQRDEHQYVLFDATTETTFRDAEVSFTGTQTSFALMPRLSGVTLDPTGGTVAASWGTLPPYDSVDIFTAQSLDSTYSSIDVTLSAGWIAKTGATRASFDAMPPGFDPSWKLDFTKQYEPGFYAYSRVGDIDYSTSVQQIVNATARTVSSPARAGGSSRARLHSRRRSPGR
jgi:hypothetical protein